MNAHDPNLKPGTDVDRDNGCFLQITLITKRGTPAFMSKRISIGEDGKLKSDGSECRMLTGTAARVRARTASELSNIVQNCGSNQAIALGALAEGLSSPVDITTKNRVAQNPGSISRSRDFIDYRAGFPGWALIDLD